MRTSEIEIGESYRLRNNPTYGYVKAVKILKPKQDENTNTYIVVKCELTVGKGDCFGFIKYFRPFDMVKEKE